METQAATSAGEEQGVVRFALIRTFSTKGVRLPNEESQHVELDLGNARAARVYLGPGG